MHAALGILLGAIVAWEVFAMTCTLLDPWVLRGKP